MKEIPLELLQTIDVEFSIQQLIWITNNTDANIIFKDGEPYLLRGEIKVNKNG